MRCGHASERRSLPDESVRQWRPVKASPRPHRCGSQRSVENAHGALEAREEGGSLPPACGSVAHLSVVVSGQAVRSCRLVDQRCAGLVFHRLVRTLADRLHPSPLARPLLHLPGMRDTGPTVRRDEPARPQSASVSDLWLEGAFASVLTCHRCSRLIRCRSVQAVLCTGCGDLSGRGCRANCRRRTDIVP